MEYIIIASQVIIALGIFNVWILRFNKSTRYRGGEAANLKEEFQVYGLPGWSVYVVGALKLSIAALLFAGIWIEGLARPAAIGMALLMLGAVAMHVKVSDPIRKALPATSLLVLSMVIVLFKESPLPFQV